MTAKLFEVEQRPKWEGGRALELAPRDPCPRCGKPTHEQTMEEPALLRHGGYGAMRFTRQVVCVRGCGWFLTLEQTEVRPPR